MLSVLKKINNVSIKYGQSFRTSAGAVVSKTEVNGKLKPWKDIPGPNALPLIGQAYHFLPGGSLYNLGGLDLIKNLCRSYGPIVRLDTVVGVEPTLLLFDADNATKILREENIYPIRWGFESIKFYRQNKEDNTKMLGLLADQGQSWKDFRSIVNPIMLAPKTIKLYEGVLEEVTQEMMERIRYIKDDEIRMKNFFDLEICMWAFESIGTIAFGRRLGCFDPNLSNNATEKKLIKSVNEMMRTVDSLDFKQSLWKYSWTPTYKKAMKIFEEHEQLAKQIIDQSIEEFKYKSSGEKSILEKLVEINKEVAYLLAIDMLIGGVDSVTYTMLSTLYLLAANPEKQQKLREEIKSDKNHNYLKACLKESLRVLPVPTGVTRKTSKEYDILGYHIPRNVHVGIMHEYMSLMDEHFIRPNEFIPERWIVDKTDPLSCKNAHPFAYNPFGFGPRSCIGRRIAELEIQIFLVQFIENFQIEWNGPTPKRSQYCGLNYIKPPHYFVIREIKK